MILTKLNRLLVATLVLLSTLSGCLLPKRAEPIPLMDPVYLWVRGVAVELQPPAGFFPAANFMGFYHDSLQVAISFNVLEKYFDDFANDYSKQNFESTGIKLFDREELTVDGKNALLLHSEYAESEYTFHHLRLAIQLGSRTILLEAIYAPSSGAGTKDYLKRSFLSFRHLKDVDENQFQRLGYDVDLSESPLSLVGVCENTAIFETSVDSLLRDEAGLMVTNYGYQFEREDTLEFILEMLQWRANSFAVEIDSMDSKMLNGMKIWTTTATHTIPNNNKTYRYFETYVFLEDSFYRIAGESTQRYSFWLSEFRRINASFKTR